MEIYKIKCPECEWEFRVEDPQINEIIACPDCKLNLKVVDIEESGRKIISEMTETEADDWGQ
jgi:lysine biosynthesis protein LysW